MSSVERYLLPMQNLLKLLVLVSLICAAVAQTSYSESQPSNSTTCRKGRFVDFDASHSVSGSVRLYQLPTSNASNPSYKSGLFLDDFSTDKGPKVYMYICSEFGPPIKPACPHVLLCPNPPWNDEDPTPEKTYIRKHCERIITGIDEYEGDFNYVLTDSDAAEVSANAMKSVAVWCDEFDVLFGYADLEGGSACGLGDVQMSGSSPLLLPLLLTAVSTLAALFCL
jgi:hypothetical protein